MANNLHFKIGSPNNIMEELQSEYGTFYLTSYEENNQDSNRLYIGTSNANKGGIMPITAPTPYHLTIKMNGQDDNSFIELNEYDGSENATVNLLINNDGVYQEGSIHAVVHYAICNTSAEDQNKTTDITGYQLIPGARAHIKFLNTNVASNPTLDISGSGPRAISFNNKLPLLIANVIYTFIYDGTNYVLLDENHRVDGLGGNYAEVFNDPNNIASGDYSHAEGSSSHAEGSSSHAEGLTSHAKGEASHAEGSETVAEGEFSHSEGSGSLAYGVAAHAEGQSGYSNQQPSITLTGDANATTYTYTESSLYGGLTIGQMVEKEKGVFCQIVSIEGDTVTFDRTVSSTALNKAVKTLYSNIALGEASHVEGRDNVAYGNYTHAEGFSTLARGEWSHAEGFNSEAHGYTSHVEGHQTKTIYGYSHAEGSETVAAGQSSHSEGSNTLAYGDAAHAEGQGYYSSSMQVTGTGGGTVYTYTTDNTENMVGSCICTSYGKAQIIDWDENNKTITLDQALSWDNLNGAKVTRYIGGAIGSYSHIEGERTTALGQSQHVQGKYNIADTTSAHIVGNGESDTTCSNAHTLDWNGNAWFSGDVYVGSTSGTNKDEGSKKLATEDFVTEAAVNADWNQNDETAKDYIKNRPFGEFEEEVVDHEETLDTFSDDGSGIYTTGSGTLGYLLGPSVLPDDCIVYFDGVRYETKHIYNDYGWLGNQSLADSTLENTGEPFCIKFLGMPEDAYNTIYTTLEGTSHTYKIAHMSETVVKIPEKYLPEISSLPPVTSDDKGKVLAVEDDGNWGAGTVTLKITDDGNGNLSVVLGVVKTIMFAINTMGSSIAEYTAEQNMTWAEWCDSKYNTIGAFIRNNIVMLLDDYYLKEYIQNVLPTDIIEAGHTYDHFISVVS